MDREELLTAIKDFIIYARDDIWAGEVYPVEFSDLCEAYAKAYNITGTYAIDRFIERLEHTS